MTMYMHELTTAIIFEYFDAIFIRKTLKFLLDNGEFHIFQLRYG